MEISQEIRLTADEITEIIKQNLEAKGHKVENVYFDIQEENMSDDHFSQYPSISVLKGARCR